MRRLREVGQGAAVLQATDPGRGATCDRNQRLARLRHERAQVDEPSHVAAALSRLRDDHAAVGVAAEHCRAAGLMEHTRATAAASPVSPSLSSAGAPMLGRSSVRADRPRASSSGTTLLPRPGAVPRPVDEHHGRAVYGHASPLPLAVATPGRGSSRVATLGRLPWVVNSERRHEHAESGLEPDADREQPPIAAGCSDERDAAREPGACAQPGRERDDREADPVPVVRRARSARSRCRRARTRRPAAER